MWRSLISPLPLSANNPPTTDWHRQLSRVLETIPLDMDDLAGLDLSSTNKPSKSSTVTNPTFSYPTLRPSPFAVK